MEKQYRILEMSDVKEGLGIIASNFLLNDPKGKLWKSKVVFEGTFEECCTEKRKRVKTAPTAPTAV